MQIGPKIRVGGTLGKIGQGLKEGVGKVAKTVAPIASFINPGLGAVLAAGGTALDTSHGGVSLGKTLASGLGAYSMGKVAGPLVNKIPGVGGMLGKIGDTASHLPGAGMAGNLLGKLGVHTSAENGGIPQPPPQIVLDGSGNVVPQQGGSGGLGGLFGGINNAANQAGMSTMDKWLMGGQILGGVAGGVGDYLAGQMNADAQKAQLAEQQRQFNTTGAAGIGNQLSTMPLRDKATFMLGHRMMQTPGQFVGAGLMGPGQMGGISPQASAQQAASYTPGAGGQGEYEALLRKLLAGMTNASG